MLTSASIYPGQMVHKPLLIDSSHEAHTVGDSAALTVSQRSDGLDRSGMRPYETVLIDGRSQFHTAPDVDPLSRRGYLVRGCGRVRTCPEGNDNYEL